MANQLYFGDNLDVLRDNIADESVDLIYLDPPFNSKANYNVLFKEVKGTPSAAQIEAFTDFWHWEGAAQTYHELVTSGDAPVALVELLQGFKQFLGENDMIAYLVMMSARLVELKRVLKPSGSIYLHCDPTAGHYLKIIMDAVFGVNNFRNEIVWRRTGSHNKANRYAPIHDLIFFYGPSSVVDRTWNYPKRPYMRGHIEENLIKDSVGYRTKYYGNVLTGSDIRHGESGKPWQGFDPTAKKRHWAIPGALLQDILEDTGEDLSALSQHEKLDRLLELGHIKIVPGQAWPIYERYLNLERDGQPTPDIWAYQPYTQDTVFQTDNGIDEDVRWLSPQDQERLGYPTQKPQALLERILKASSNEGDVILDPFCGCGTTIAAAQALNRRWIGVDITYLAINLIKSRLADHFGEELEYELHGIPKDWESARELAVATDKPRKEFELWALSLVKASPKGDPSKKGGGDKGIDGIRFFMDKGKGNKTVPHRIIIQVKSDQKPKPSYVRDLRGVVEREKAVIGALILLHRPGKRSELYKEAASAGFYHSELYQRDYPMIQILCIEDLLEGTARLEFPEAAVIDTRAVAPKINKNDAASQLDID